MEDVGPVRMLPPGSWRRCEAIFGKRWGRLRDQMEILYGGIDSKEVTRRGRRPGRCDGGHPADSFGTAVACGTSSHSPSAASAAISPKIPGRASCLAPPPRPTRRSAGPSPAFTGSSWDAATPPTRRCRPHLRLPCRGRRRSREAGEELDERETYACRRDVIDAPGRPPLHHHAGRP